MNEITSGGANVSGSIRNWLIGATLVVAGAIIFGLLYLFVIAPSVPNGSVGWFLFAFATGLTMIIMPCTLPLAFVIVPLSMGKGLVRGLGIAIAFGLGVATTLSLYGVVAAVVGDAVLNVLGADLEALKNWVYFIAGTFAFLFALSEIGLLNVHMPTYAGAAPAFIQKQQEIIKAFCLGLFLGNVGVGCPHPATPLILIEIATSGDILYGWLMFLIHAIGRILPLLLLAFLAILGVNGLNWLMTRKATLERVTGWAMVFVAGFILTLGLFSHDWWVNSGIHSGLEAITQESRFNAVMNQTLGTNVAHVHGLEDGVGLFGQPLEWGHWFLVLVWLIPMWWWYMKRRREMHSSPSFHIRELEAKLDAIETERRHIESTVKLDDLEVEYDLAHVEKDMDELERLRRIEEDKVAFGESGTYKDPVAREYEEKILGMRRTFIIFVSISLALTFGYMLPQNFYYKAMSGLGGHGDHAESHSDSTQTNTVQRGTPLSTDTRGLPEAKDPEFVTLNAGDTYVLTASYVKKEVGNHTLRMMAYNGSVPGPFIRVPQGGEVKIVFVNNTDIDQTIHSHGVRLNNAYDGVVGVTQDAVKPGESFTYTITFPDAGVAWYHPHTRDDIGQELGLYGNYFVHSSDSQYYNSVNREVPLVLDDILIENGKVAAFYAEYVDHALLGRFGNTYLVNGEVDYSLNVTKGEVIRFFLTNASNARTYRLSIPGALIKRVGGDVSKYELETFENELVVSPAERIIFEAYFSEDGTYKLINRMKEKSVEVGRFIVESNDALPTTHHESFLAARKDLALSAEFDAIRTEYLNREPEKKLRLTVALTGAVDHSAHAHGSTPTGSDGHDHGSMDHSSMNASSHTMMQTDPLDTIQWDDPTNSDAINTTKNVTWKIIDEATGKENMNIPLKDWTFTQGQYVKMRITNDMMAAHVMQHPIHFHGQRFVVLTDNGVLNKNMVWRDTALVLPGGYIDIVVDMSNTGVWMTHCHIVEHLFAGMMMEYRVQDANGYAAGDEYRNSKTITSSTVSSSDSATPTTTFTYDSVVDNAITVKTHKAKYNPSSPEYIEFSFTDKDGKGIMLDPKRPVALTATFISKNGKDHFTSFPGNIQIHKRTGNPNENTPGTPGFDESMPHSHSFNIPSLIPYAFADAGHAHNGVAPTNFVPSYSVPVYFTDEGEYKVFVEFYVEGDDKPFVSSTIFTVGKSSWNIDSYGWSKEFKWWFLLIVSLLLMLPLSLYVRQYINKNT
jgi:suppressor of ftsI